MFLVLISYNNPGMFFLDFKGSFQLWKLQYNQSTPLKNVNEN